MKQLIDDEESLDPAWPSPEQFDLVADAVDKVLHNEATRSAWLMGFLTGSALAGETGATGVSKLKRIRGRPRPRTA